MKIDKKDVQCIYFGGNHLGNPPHPVHRAWMESVSSRPLLPFIPKKLAFVRDWGPFFNQPLSFINSFFIPKAKVYLLTGVGNTLATFRKPKGVKVISINSDTFFMDLKNASYLRKKYSLFLLKQIDGFVSTSNMMKELAKKYTFVPHKVVYPFYNVKKFLRIKPDYKSINICSIATARYSKGADILKEVFKIYKNKFKDSKLFVLGKGDLSEMLRKEKSIINPDWADPKDYFPKSGIYINTARIEPFGVNILEAMAAGLPPLVSKYCGAAEIVKKIDPWLITSLNPKEIAKKAIELQINIKRKKELGKKAKKIALEYTKNRSIKNFEKAFEKLL